MRQADIRWLLVLLANLLLLWLTGLANHYLSEVALPFGGRATIYLYTAGMMVGYAALRLDYRHGFLATAFTGLAFDAMQPVPFGTHLVLLGLVHATLLYGRRRFPRDEPIFATVVALFANLFLFLALSFVLISVSPRPATAWLRLFVDLLCSQAVVALATPWFMALNARVLQLARLNPETGRRAEL
jgi:cell shape-determining protein MreD